MPLLQGPGKKWESYELNKNGNPVRIPMHVKKGDTVVVITGRDKGKVGEVSQVCIVPLSAKKTLTHHAVSLEHTLFRL